MVQEISGFVLAAVAIFLVVDDVEFGHLCFHGVVCLFDEVKII